MRACVTRRIFNDRDACTRVSQYLSSLVLFPGDGQV